MSLRPAPNLAPVTLAAQPLRRHLQRSPLTSIEPTPIDELMMRRALELARHAADQGEAPIGAVVYRTDSSQILGEGFNTREAKRDPTHHAEILAIQAASRALGDWRLSGCTLVVTLEPCVMCAGAIVAARVGRVVYGAHDPKAGAVRSLYRLLEDPRLNHRIRPITGLLAEESAEKLRAFFRARRGNQTDSIPDDARYSP